MTTIFTDGSSRGNPGPGGWGVVVVSDQGGTSSTIVTELGGSERMTTNNRMELMAAICGLRKASEPFGTLPNDAESFGILRKVTVYTDSSYIVNGITKWIHGWKRNGWKTKTKDDVQNKDLWMELDAVVAKVGPSNISWKYVGGHVGIAGNERCDVIATSFADMGTAQLYEGPLTGYPIKNILDISYDEARVRAKSSASSRSNAKAYSYISAIGSDIRIHRTWAECEKRVKGVKGARFKKSLDALDEAEIIDEFSTY